MSSNWFDDDAFELPEIEEILLHEEPNIVNDDDSLDVKESELLRQRLQTTSPLNFRCPPTLDEKVFSKIVKEIASVIHEVIPNAGIRGIGPAFHDCGSFLNFSINEKTKEIQSIWFFFGLCVIICDEKGNEIPNINELLIQLWIKKIQIKLHDDGIAQHSDIVLKKNSHKLFFEHKNTPAKVTVVFCATEVLKRSQLIRYYTKLCPKMLQVAYLYNNLILTNPVLHDISNTCLCYLIIHFLQQTNRIDILPSSLISEKMCDIKIMEQLSKLAQKYAIDSVALLCYEFAKFYSAFNFGVFIIDIGQRELCFWTDADNSGNKSPVGIRCGFSGRNLGKQISMKCLEAFTQKMKEIVEAFESGTEAAAFPADIEEFAKKPLPPRTPKNKK